MLKRQATALLTDSISQKLQRQHCESHSVCAECSTSCRNGAHADVPIQRNINGGRALQLPKSKAKQPFHQATAGPPGTKLLLSLESLLDIACAVIDSLLPTTTLRAAPPSKMR